MERRRTAQRTQRRSGLAQAPQCQPGSGARAGSPVGAVRPVGRPAGDTQSKRGSPPESTAMLQCSSLLSDQVQPWPPGPDSNETTGQPFTQMVTTHQQRISPAAKWQAIVTQDRFLFGHAVRAGQRCEFLLAQEL